MNYDLADWYNDKCEEYMNSERINLSADEREEDDTPLHEQIPF